MALKHPFSSELFEIELVQGLANFWHFFCPWEKPALFSMMLELYPQPTVQKNRANRNLFGPLVEDEALSVTTEILKSLLGPVSLPSLNVRLWDGTFWPDKEPRAATLVLNRPSALREMLSGGSEISVTEAYIRGAFDIEGDMIAACDLADVLAEQTQGWTKTLSVATQLMRLPHLNNATKTRRFQLPKLNGRKHSLERDRQAIQFHYDVSNEFYALWLDSRMVYSCGYFETVDTSLEQAQFYKLDHICRKLGLHSDERLLDIGCGWGALLLYAAKHYGVQAMGITLSQRQFEWVKRRIQEENLGDRVTVQLKDYRELPSDGSYDKIASVGMVEHVGDSQLPVYFKKVSSLLKPGGLFLNHGIGLGSHLRKNEKEGFIEKFVFPDSDLQPIGRMLLAAEEAQFDVRDVESLREHYAKTLRHWVMRLEARHDEAVAQIGEEAYHIWRLYMAGSAHGFQRGHLSIYQTLLAKTDSHGTAQVPLTRKDWYMQNGCEHCT